MRPLVADAEGQRCMEESHRADLSQSCKQLRWRRNESGGTLHEENMKQGKVTSWPWQGTGCNGCRDMEGSHVAL